MKLLFTLILAFVLSIANAQTTVPDCDDQDKNALYLTYINFGGQMELWKIDSITTDPTELQYIETADHDLIGLTISRNLINDSPEFVFYGTGTDSHYYLNEGLGWIDTGHLSGNIGSPINTGGGNEYVYSRVDGSFEIFRYDGSGNGVQLGVSGFGDYNSVWDVATDMDDNFYIYNTDLQQILMYTPEGIPVDTFPTAGGPTGVHPGFAIIGDDVYAWTNSKELWRGVRTNDQFDFTVIADYPKAIQFYDIATCPNRGNVLGVWENPEFPHLALYPNPSSENVSVRMHNTALLEIYDVNGKLVYRENPNGLTIMNVNVSQYAPGMYIVKATNDRGEQAIEELIVQ